jgi:hypothetical protein
MDGSNVGWEGKDFMTKLGGYCKSFQTVALAMFLGKKDLNYMGELGGRPKINDSFGMQVQ